MSTHPYKTLPDYAFWSRSVALPALEDVDPVVAAKFKITPDDRVATGGSCFAQHIGRELAAAGFNYFVTETAHPAFEEAAAGFNYGIFTARYGNIYTARQLLQLFHRAYGLFVPLDAVWHEANGRLKDPFRPEIQPAGFASMIEFQADQRQHFVAVRRAVEEMDVFAFTLGLTETWRDRRDGAIYPLCPGVSGGAYDPARHEFVNLTVDEVTSDLRAAIAFIKERNPKVRIVITVSPVPLVATYEPRSVLESTTYSKSVLRVAAEQVCGAASDVAYFPSYEIITGNHARGAYFGDDLRSVTDEGVSHVMRLFFRHYTDTLPHPQDAARRSSADIDEAAQRHRRKMRKVAALICDEEQLDGR